jgi:hypothetical protein
MENIWHLSFYEISVVNAQPGVPAGRTHLAANIPKGIWGIHSIATHEIGTRHASP